MAPHRAGVAAAVPGRGIGHYPIDEVEADDISAWFAHLRSAPAARGKVRSERTIQTYARSVRAFFHWLVRRGTLQSNPYYEVTFWLRAVAFLLAAIGIALVPPPKERHTGFGQVGLVIDEEGMGD